MLAYQRVDIAHVFVALLRGYSLMEQHKVAQVLKEEMNLCREGQNDVARQVLAKMAELNEKLGANMATLEDWRRTPRDSQPKGVKKRTWPK
eukprot:Skav206920  [mRNA]  locus=scaffold808:827925:831105:+ [translate_table: standard]